MHLKYIMSLYASFGLNLSEDEYTQFSRNTCCYSSSIYPFFSQRVDSSRASTELRQRCITLISASQTERRKLKLLSERQFSSSSRFPAPWDHGFELRCDAAHRDARVPGQGSYVSRELEHRRIFVRSGDSLLWIPSLLSSTCSTLLREGP